jgi:hypothetical protein
MLNTNTKTPADAEYYSFGRYYKKWSNRNVVFIWDCNEWVRISLDHGISTICADINIGDGYYIYKMSNGDSMEVCLKPEKSKKGHVIRSVHDDADMRDFYSSIAQKNFNRDNKMLDFAGSAIKDADGEIIDCLYGLCVDDTEEKKKTLKIIEAFKTKTKELEKSANKNKNHFFKFLVTRKK